MNRLTVSLQQSIITLHARGWSARRIARELGMHRETVGRQLKLSKPAKVTTGSAAEAEAKPANVATGSASEVEAKPAKVTIGGSGRGHGGSGRGQALQFAIDVRWEPAGLPGMARPLRLESEAGVYHVLNRGNYRADIFRTEKAKEAFLTCLAETCAQTGWEVHAWCLMSNHYHLAVSTPQANLVDGMRWLQGTFAVRFNRFRNERGHLFQGRYKSLLVDPADGLGPLCHYIQLNPVRAKLCPVAELSGYRWTSLPWLLQPKERPSWYHPEPALAHAGGLADTPAGRRKYLAYLAWLAEDEPARKAQKFSEMSKGWIIGTAAFAKTVHEEHKEALGQGRRMAAVMQATREGLWQDALTKLLRQHKRTTADIAQQRKSAGWKVAIAAALKQRTTATNRWIGTALNMGGLHSVSRQVSAWHLSQKKP